MAWSPWLSNLNDVLADLYPTVEESRRIVECAGMQPRLIRFDPSSLVNWFTILKETDKSHGNKPGHPTKAYAIIDCALKDRPDHDILLALKRDEPPAVKGPDLTWEAPPDPDHLEKIIGKQSTLLPINFLEIGMTRARSVARIVRKDGASGTGFLIGGGWLITNNHVLPDAQTATGANAEFNYQATVDDLDAAVTRYPVDPARFYTSVENDWAVVGIDAAAETAWGTLKLERVETAVDAFVNIIQHPGGGPKRIGLYHNTVVYAGKGRVQYLTDTLPGSSGAPVFNDQWQVVALHHSGGMIQEPGKKKSFYRNEGIAVTTLLDDLAAKGVTLG